MSAKLSALHDLELALQLQREDLEHFRDRRKGKGPEGETDDLDLAIQLYEAELASCATIASDHTICRSIARAVRQDADLIGTILLQEKQAAQDREFANNLSRNRRATAPARPPSPEPTPDAELLARLEALYLSPFDQDEHPAESSAWAASRLSPSTGEAEQPQKMIECISCSDKRPQLDISRCPCSHNYCRDCLQSLFHACLSDESLFPPRCCGKPIPLDSCRAHLSSTLAGEFLAKKVEFETPNRTYCHQPACSAFIPPQFIDGEVGTCVRCKNKTCAVCKGSSHQGDCPHDPAAQALLAVAQENGWQQCYGCRRLVELDHGCNHMSKSKLSFFPRLTCFFLILIHASCCSACRCGAQFCYVCGQRWKTCGCEQWNEEHLVARANEIVNRDAGAQQLDNARRAGRVERERRNLIENHECEHSRWRGRGGVHRCEECHNLLPLFIYECMQCRIMACRRCRFNRL